MSTSNKSIPRPTIPPPPPPKPKRVHLPNSNSIQSPPPRPPRPPSLPHPTPPPKKVLNKQSTESDLLSFLTPLKNVFKQPTPPTPTTRTPSFRNPPPSQTTRTAPRRSTPRNDLVSLLFPPPRPRPPPVSSTQSRPPHNPPPPPRQLPSKPTLMDDLHSFFFHPRNKTAKIVNRSQSRGSMQADPPPRSRAVQLSSYGQSRSCTNLTFDSEVRVRDNHENIFGVSGNSYPDEIWRLPTPLEPNRPNTSVQNRSNARSSEGPGFSEVLPRPVSEMTVNTRREGGLKGILKRSVSSGAVNLSETNRVRDAGSEESYSECTICCEKGVESVFIPCGHMCMCFDCAMDYWEKKPNGECPICRSPCSGVFRTFAS